MKKRNNIDKFQGYPHYPAKDDITRANNNNGKQPFEKPENPPPRFVNDTIDDRDDEVSIVPGTDADVSAEDVRMLEAADQNMDTMDSSNLLHSSLDNLDDDGDPLNEDSSISMDMSGEDLDVPGSSDDDANENIGEEDEENNYYSLGGDLHENQEEYKGE
jgi:hypothetical protein